MSRPVGLSAGSLGLVLAWLGGLSMAQLTGATPVLIMLAAGLVLLLAAIPAGYLVVRRVRVGDIVLPSQSNQGGEIALTVDVAATQAVWLEIRSGGQTVASGWSLDGRFTGSGSMQRRGAVEELQVRVRSAGGIGLVWWRRDFCLPIERHVVAPHPRAGDAVIERSALGTEGEHAGSPGAIAGEIDGVRPWREGDSEKFVHWSSTLRAGELIVHDRRHSADERWLVRARPGLPDPDAEAGIVRAALEQGLRSGALVDVALADAEPVAIPDLDAVASWTALAELGASPMDRPGLLARRWRTEPETTARLSARWWAGGATFVSLAMLAGALGLGALVVLIIAFGVFGGTAVSSRTLTTGERASALVRTLIGVGTLLALALVIAASGRVDGLLSVLRGPLPQVLIILVVLHGFECRDRRTIRVGLGISALVLMYASGFRVDGAVGWWLAAWGVAFGFSIAELSGPTRDARSTKPSVSYLPSWPSGGVRLPAPPRLASLGAGAVLTAGVLSVVPIPEGPARLTMPTFLENVQDISTPGAIVGPDGEVRDAGDDSGDGQRAPAAQTGGYTGFAQSMDTSVRGNLSDEIVMRVRAPEPDFWRGQTFSTFDGRRWYADEGTGIQLTGPNITLPDALGDSPGPDDVAVERFVQTYFVEADMPNVVFHAYQPEQLVLDADVWARSDGAIRSSTVLNEGSVYTVVSSRAAIDEQILRRQGIIGPRLTALGSRVFARYLEVPATTSPETIALAKELADGLTSTYDVVRAYEAWMSANVEYDLNAPLPAADEDAVHDFLFDTQLGFCEQIASALTVMLRTQGVPARLATGYVSGERDRVTGVFEVKGSDAHAWVEVWFPETGWQPFDPTAAVPLSANAEIESVGADLVVGFGGYVGERPLTVMLVLAAGAGVVVSFVAIRDLRRRHRRGRWGVLQDRFSAAARQRGAEDGASNPRLATVWTSADDADVARMIAERLDRVAFDPVFDDDDQYFDDTRRLVGSLPGPDR